MNPLNIEAAQSGSTPARVRAVDGQIRHCAELHDNNSSEHCCLPREVQNLCLTHRLATDACPSQVLAATIAEGAVKQLW